jgi:hypothetical protein
MPAILERDDGQARKPAQQLAAERWRGSAGNRDDDDVRPFAVDVFHQHIVLHGLGDEEHVRLGAEDPIDHVIEHPRHDSEQNPDVHV